MRLRANLWLHLGSYSSPVGTMLKIRAFGCWWVWMVQKGGYALPNPGMGPNTNSLVQMKSRTVHFQGRPHRRIAETLLVGRPKRRNNIARLIHYSTETLKVSCWMKEDGQQRLLFRRPPTTVNGGIPWCPRSNLIE